MFYKNVSILSFITLISFLNTNKIAKKKSKPKGFLKYIKASVTTIT